MGDFKTRKHHARRYYLHGVLKQKFKVDAESRSIDISPYRCASEIPVPYRWYVGQLIKLGYNAQLKLL
jgi:hypothetical protein